MAGIVPFLFTTLFIKTITMNSSSTTTSSASSSSSRIIIYNDDNNNTNDNDKNDKNKNIIIPTSTSPITTAIRRNSNILPKTLYLIFGLESSGTTFVAKTISTVVLSNGINYNKIKGDHDVWEDYSQSIFIQHISLPIGGFGGNIRNRNIPGTQERMQKNLETIDVFLPKKCKKSLDGICSDDSLLLLNNNSNNNNTDTDTTTATNTNTNTNTNTSTSSATNKKKLKIKSLYTRYFVNITNHIRWYENRGVIVKPIVVIRDEFFHSQTTIKKHCWYIDACKIQYNIGRQIIKETIHNFNSNNNDNNNNNNKRLQSESSKILIVSYETLMILQETYLIDYIYKSLNINSTYVPEFIDGNLKHAKNILQSQSQLQSQSSQSSEPFTINNNNMQRQKQQQQQATTTTTMSNRQFLAATRNERRHHSRHTHKNTKSIGTTD
jgi:hypothetical protein